MSDLGSGPAGVGPAGRMVFIHAGDATGGAAAGRRGLSCCRLPGNPVGKKRAMVIRPKLKRRGPPARTSTQKGLLKTKLKISRRTGAAGQDSLEMLERLAHGIAVRAGRRGMFPIKPGAPHLHPPMPSAPQPVERFQRKGQPQLFRRRLAGQPGQHLDQPRPHQRSPQSVTRQDVRQEKDKGASAPAAQPAIGTIHPLPQEGFAVRHQGIIAQRPAVPVQTANAAAMRTGRLLERKSWVFNSWSSRTK